MKRKNAKGYRVATVIAIVAISLACGVAAYASYIPTPKGTPIMDQAVVVARIQTLSEMADYVQEVEAKNTRLSLVPSGTLATTITFNRYLTFSEFEEYVEKYDIQIAQLQLRAFDQDGTRISIFTKTNDGLAETAKRLNSQAEAEGFTIAGISGVCARLDSDCLIDAQNDSLTYLVDTSGSDCGAYNTQQSQGEKTSPVYPKSLTWQLETLGVIK